MRYGVWLIAAQIVIAQTAAPPAVQVSPARLSFDDTNFSYSQSIAVTTDTDSAVIDVTTDGGSPGSPTPAWLDLGTRTITTPGRVRASINASRLPGPGSYSARILLRSRGSNNAPAVPVPVTLSRGAADIPFSVSPTSIRFVAQVGGFLPGQYIVLPPGVSCSEVTARTSDAWLTVAPEPVYDCNRFLVSARALRGEPGAYRGTITLGFQDERVTVRVTGFLLPAGPWLDTNANGYQFEVRQGNGNSLTRNLAILNRGSGTLNWTARDVFGPTQWLSLGAVAGTATSNTDGRLPVTVTPGQLAVGTYHAVIEIDAEGARGSPDLFTLVMKVNPPDAPAVATPSPSGLLFSVVEGSGQSDPQVETIFTSSNTQVPYRVWPQPETEGATWLLVSSTSGTTSTGNAGRLNIAVNPGSLGPGIYTGVVNTYVLSRGGTDIRAVNVTMIVQPKPPPTPPRGAAGDSGGRLAANCTPTRLAPTHTALVSNFATSVGWPTPINLRIVDDCGDAVNGAQAVLSFSNGDPPLVLENLLNGNYAGTWVARSTTTPVTIRANVAQANLSATLELSGNVSPTAIPVVDPNGVVNNFDRQPAGPLAPGTLIEIYGANLSGGTSLAKLDGNNKLPDAVNDVSVVLGNARLPLYAVSPGQLNAQIRMDASPNQTLPLVVRSGTSLSVPVRVPMLAQQPGLLAFADTKIIAHDENFVLLSATNPAKRGRPIILYLVGMGATAPLVDSGALSPGQPLAASAMQPTVTMGGKQAQVLFAGLTPGFVGLYQINILVPPSLTPGDVTLSVQQGSSASNDVIVPVQ